MVDAAEQVLGRRHRPVEGGQRLGLVVGRVEPRRGDGPRARAVDEAPVLADAGVGAEEAGARRAREVKERRRAAEFQQRLHVHLLRIGGVRSVAGRLLSHGPGQRLRRRRRLGLDWKFYCTNFEKCRNPQRFRFTV